jgi:hypothetical protein
MRGAIPTGPIRFHDVLSYAQGACYVVLTSNCGPNDTNVMQVCSCCNGQSNVSR